MNSIKLAKLIRYHSLKMTSSGNSSHIGSILSCADILAVLYEDFLSFRSDEPYWLDRDRFIMSKGHAGAGVYAALALNNFISVDELNTHYKNGSRLSGHISHKVPGVEISTGSLGHGLPIACGIAYAGKLNSQKYKSVVLMSDGECDEGSNWEAALFASHHKLNNLIVIIDYNKLQSISTTEETLALEPFAEKWSAFGWNVKEVDGHNHNQLKNTLSSIKNIIDKPTCIIANTVKGKGISFMEDQVLWHYKSPDNEELQAALSELNHQL